jgi:multidrug efflux pump subunit AcrA (membrane-fusion protein)
VQVSGTVQGSRQVAIKPQVSGTIEQRLFDEGSEVQEGDPLYRIDPRPFQARLDAAQAQLAVDQANLEFADADAEVERRAIEVQKSYKRYWVVRKGLEASERVISAETQKVCKSGMVVKIAEPAGKEEETKASDTAG